MRNMYIFHLHVIMAMPEVKLRTIWCAATRILNKIIIFCVRVNQGAVRPSFIIYVYLSI